MDTSSTSNTDDVRDIFRLKVIIPVYHILIFPHIMSPLLLHIKNPLFQEQLTPTGTCVYPFPFLSILHHPLVRLNDDCSAQIILINLIMQQVLHNQN